MMSDASEQHTLRWKCETDLATLRAAVTGVRDEMRKYLYPRLHIGQMPSGFAVRWRDDLTAALDAAPVVDIETTTTPVVASEGDASLRQAAPRGESDDDVADISGNIIYADAKPEADIWEILTKRGAGDTWKYSELLKLMRQSPPPPAPVVGIDPEAVRKVRDRMQTLWDLPSAGKQFSGWHFATQSLTALIAAAGEQEPEKDHKATLLCPGCSRHVEVVHHASGAWSILATGEQGPMVPLAVVDEVARKIQGGHNKNRGHDETRFSDGCQAGYGQSYIWLMDALALYRRAPKAAAGEPDVSMCAKCGKYPAEHAQTICEFCMGIKPDAPDPCTTEERAAWWLEEHSNLSPGSALWLLGAAMAGDKDDKVRAHLAARDQGAKDGGDDRE